MTTTTAIRAKVPDQRIVAQVADWLAVAVAVSLPWSTSATGILIVLWLVAVAFLVVLSFRGVLPTLDAAAVRRELATAAGGLPVLLWALAALGMLWADVTWSERFAGMGSFNKLLVVPLLLAQFRRSEHGIRVLFGFLLSVSGVLLFSWVLVLFPGLPWQGHGFGVPVKDYILQSTDFLICAFVLFGIAFDDSRSGRWRAVAGLVALAALFLVNIAFVITGRTALLVAPVLVLLLGWRQFRWKGLVAAALVGCVVAGAVWLESPRMRARLDQSVLDLQNYLTSDTDNSVGLHLEFLKKSLAFVETAPVIGHGTGSIPEQFRNAVGRGGADSVASVNPHNQILAVAIQLGLLGAAILVAMWVAHFMLFRGTGLTAWVGMIVVVQNVVSSLFNSHLFDFTQGWLYVFGVGVAGGMALRERDAAHAERRATS